MERHPTHTDNYDYRSWLIVALVTIFMFVEVGTIKAFGVLLPELKDQFSTTTWIAGSCIAIITACGYILGMLSDAAVKITSPTCCIMLCGLISSVGLIVCACATSPYSLLAGEILTGFLLLQETVAVGIVPYYLDGHYFATAVSIYTCGTGLGMIIMPIVTQTLLEEYGWRGTLWLLSGICLNLVPLSFLIKPPRRKTLYRKASTCHGGVLQPWTHWRQPESFAGHNSQNHDNKRNMFTMLLRMPFIARVLIPGMVVGYILYGWMIYVISFALSNGASAIESSIVATCGGIGLTLIRLVLPCLHQVMTYQQLMYTSSGLTAVSLILNILYVSFIPMCVISVVFGVGIGVLGTEMYVAANDVVDEDEQMLAVAWLHLVIGFSSILSGFVTGWFYDSTSSFTRSFSILAAVSSLIIVSLGCEDVWMGITQKKPISI